MATSVRYNFNWKQIQIQRVIYLGDYIPNTKSNSDPSKRKHHSYFDKEDEPLPEPQAPLIGGPSRSHQLLTRLAQEPEGYAECYPGLEEMQDAIDDSDDEVDYSKMDLGNKKGPIGKKTSLVIKSKPVIYFYNLEICRSLGFWYSGRIFWVHE